MELHLDAMTKAHMEAYHRISPTSTWYYQPFKSAKTWVKHDYPSSGLQAVNTRTFVGAFLHPPGVPLWGWSEDYVDKLAARLVARTKIPAVDLAVWLYRGRSLPDTQNTTDLVERFLAEYRITPEERVRLFRVETAPNQSLPSQEALVDWSTLQTELGTPPDAAPERGATLHRIELSGTGPARTLSMAPAEHLTLVTGDNGLGKTFLLECAWWALTGTWSGRPALPRPDATHRRPNISFAVRSKTSAPESVSTSYDWRSQTWPPPKPSRSVTGLVVYARVDGSFAVWDPAKAPVGDGSAADQGAAFSSEQIWNGRGGDIEGLVRDWGRWQHEPKSWSFRTFVRLLKDLSPPDLGDLVPGELTRIPDDRRQIPTIKHAYGETPILYASAGVKRILGLSYLMVWAWQEHRVASELSRQDPETRMVVLIDEIEAHLHPKWQRTVLPAVVGAVHHLESNLNVQLIVTTHAPLVLASAETIFDEDHDRLLHLRADEDNVTLQQVPFIKYGEASRWLTSPVFDMKQARSREAEQAIEAAKRLQKDSRRADLVSVQRATEDLRKFLPSDDPFWPRWIGFADRFGVDV